MGYYASGNGAITFKRILTDKEVNAVDDILCEAFECDYCEIREKSSFSIWNSEKYHGDSVEYALRNAAKVAEIEDGEIEYVGEDGSLWRFIYVPNDDPTTICRGHWEEQSGRVVYDVD